MFHFRKLLEPNQPKRRIGLLVGVAIVFAAMGLLNPYRSSSHAADEKTEEAAKEEPADLPARADEKQVAALYDGLKARHIKLEERKLALDRESETLDEARGDLKGQLVEIQKQRAVLDERIKAWETRRSEERKQRLERVVAIVGQMTPDGAAKIIGQTEAELAVDVLLALDEKRAGKILVLLPSDEAAKLARAMSDSRH